MSKVKYYIIIIFISLIVFLIPNTSNAAVEVSRNFYSNEKMQFIFTGLKLDVTHEYEYGITSTATTQVNDWFLITEITESSATVEFTLRTSGILEVVNSVDTGYITIKDKTTDTIVLESYSVDLKLPYLHVTNYTVIDNGKNFDRTEENSINVLLKTRGNSEAYYQYEKIIDQSVIDKYKEIKSQNGDISELETMLKTTTPTDNWSVWDYWNGWSANGLENGYGYPETPIAVPDEGLYYLWLYFSNTNAYKNVYGYILVDNLDVKVSGSNEQNRTNENNQININNAGTSNKNNTQISGSDSTTSGKILPKTGNSLIIIVGIMIIIVISAGLYIKNKQYKDIK